jgi:tetratricopeptide (TPR) repeat protein
VSVDPLFELAAFYHASGDNAAALGELGRAISRQPENPETWYQKAQLLVRLGLLREALEPLLHAKKLDVDYSFAVTDLRQELTRHHAGVK